MSMEYFTKSNFDFDLHTIRRNIFDDATPSLFSDEDLQRKIQSKEDAESFLNNSDVEITKKQIDDIKKEMCRLKFDLEYFIKAYTWVEEDIINRANTTYTNRLFYLFNNLAYQLREFTGCLLSYSDKCYLSIYNDLKEEIISAYNVEIRENLETLYRLDQESKRHLKDRVDHIKLKGNELSEILKDHTLNEIFRCLQKHPSEEIRQEFDNVFYEDAIYSPFTVFCFDELFSYANDVKEAIKKIEQPKNAYRTIKECEYLYDVLYERFQANHAECKKEAEEALEYYLLDHQLERNAQNIIKRKDALILVLKNTTLGKIWDEYHHDKSKLVENIVNAEASRDDFEEYFRYIIKIEYLSECANNIINLQNEEKNENKKVNSKSVFKENADIEKIIRKLNNFIDKKILKAQVHWFIVYKVFCSLDWLKTSVQTKFIDQINLNFQNKLKTTAEDFKQVDSYFKNTDIYEWNKDDPKAPKRADVYIKIRNALFQEFTEEKYSTPGKRITSERIKFK